MKLLNIFSRFGLPKTVQPDADSKLKSLMDEISFLSYAARSEIDRLKAASETFQSVAESTDAEIFREGLRRDCEAMRLQINNTMTNLDMISSMQMAVGIALAKLNISLDSVAPTDADPEMKIKTVADLKQLTAAESNRFLQSGGLIEA